MNNHQEELGGSGYSSRETPNRQTQMNKKERRKYPSLRSFTWSEDPEKSEGQLLVENTVQEWYDAKHATSSIFEIEFINSDNFFKALAEIDDDNALFEILKVGLIALTLTIVFLSYYSFCKVNNVRFQILELYGLPKRNRPLMLLIGNLASSIISFLISSIVKSLSLIHI